jgi:L-seryl-tRNA(Ser) seleniumtransferase
VSGGALGDLPRVDRVVAHPLLAAARARLGAPGLTSLARRAIADARRAVRAGEPCPTLDAVAGRVAAMADATLRSRARRVINASGVILHTNLGRAPLARAAARALAEDAGGYTSVEIDLTTGRRGARGAFAEAALIVNNNAAAVLLALGALTARADRRAVLVSRSELIEIGGGFRVPDVLTRSGARLVEVGTTNRTRVEDYARALDETGDVAAILRVHQGNFRQTGFVERPSLSALAALARARGVLLVKDLGGGALIDLGVPGLAGEPLVRDTITAGVDLVCFSTDKVLGGPQGGALVGRADLVERARRDPLARALRLGRLPLVALEATLACYLEGALEEIPAVAAMRASLASVRARAAAWQAALAARGVGSAVVDVDAVVGGGAYAEVPIASAGLALDAPDACSAEEVSRRLRAVDLPIVARIHDGRVVVDARTVLPSEDRALLDGIVAALGPR